MAAERKVPLFHWLPGVLKPFSVRPDQAERLLLAGDLDDLKAAPLPAEARDILTTTLHFLKGNYGEIHSPGQHLDAPHARVTLALAAIAFFRRGQEDEARKLFAKLGEGEIPHGVPELIAAHEASALMNQGFFLAALERAKRLLEADKLDVHDAYVASATADMCSQALGRFRDAAGYQELEQRSFALFPFPPWQAAILRRRANLLVLQENLSDALPLIEEGLRLRSPNVVNHLLLQKLRMKARLSFGEVATARSELESIEATISRERIPPSSFSPDEEVCELALVLGPAGKAVEVARTLLARAVGRSDLAAECSARTFLAAGLAQLNEPEQASAQLSLALQLARSQEYHSFLSTLLKVAAGIHLLQGDAEIGRQYLSELETQARRLGRQRTARMANATLECVAAFRSEEDSWRLALVQEPGPEAEAFLRTWTGWMKPKFAVRGGTRLLAPAEIVRAASRADLVFFWEKPGVLLWREKGRVRLQNLSSSRRSSERVFAELLRRGSIEPAAILHIQRERKVEFHPLRHGPAVRALMSRLRHRLSQAGLSLDWNGSRYVLTLSVRKLMVVRPSAKETGFRHEKASRVLEYLRQHGPASTAALTAHFEFSRQALHRHIQELMRAGLVMRTGHARATVYRAR